MTRRPLLRAGALATLAALALLASAWAPSSAPVAGQSAQSAPPQVTVFKDPNCGCCKAWVEHLRQHAFTVVARDTSDVASVKRTARVPERLNSCHTAFVNGYVVEGHVPAEDIHRLLREKPRVAGIAVAGMPIGSPGMEVGDRKEAYDVVSFTRDGRTSVFAKH